MAKAVTGAVEVAAGLVLLASPIGGALGALWLPLVMSGVASEFGAIASILQKDPGMSSTVRQAASPRRVIYGQYRVGGVEVFEATTGSSLDQYLFIIVFAGHECQSIDSLYLDGRQVHFTNGSTAVPIGANSGLGGNGVTYTDQSGNNYSFADATSGHNGIWCEGRLGTQGSGDYITGIYANDSAWGEDSSGRYPTLYGCTYIGLKCEYNTTTFPSKPDVKATIKGKQVYDPRTGETAWTSNWALCVADFIQDSQYGLGGVVDNDSLIAAANISDEQAAYYGGGGGMEARYTCNYTFTTDKSPDTILSEMLASAAGRMAYIDGKYFIFAGTYSAPTLSFTSASLVAAPTWTPQRKWRDKANIITGQYVAAAYPYSVAGDEYDNTTLEQNNFSLCWTPDSFPPYACDITHGYASNQYLTEDNNVELATAINLPACVSLSQAQRVAKINLLRNRQQGSGTLTFGVEGWQLQPNDTFLYSDPKRGWTDKILEVSQVSFQIQNNDEGVPEIRTQLAVCETDPTVYEWNPTDELTPYDVPAFNPGTLYATQPPTDMVLTSSAATALTQPDGTVIPRIQVTWNTPADSRVVSIQLQYQLVGASTWSDGGTVSVASNIAFINAVSGSEYDVRIRSLRSNGGYSNWVEIDGFTAGLLLSVGTQDGVGIGSLQSVVLSGGSVVILCNAFTAQYGYNFVSIFPSGTVTLTNDGTLGGSGSALVQKTLYYVYYVDPTYAGGNVTPIATTNKADFLGKIGYFLIDSVVTPAAASGSGTGGSGVYYQPSTYNAVSGTTNPTYAYDGDSTTFSFVEGMAVQVTTPGFGGDPPTTEETDSSGDCTWLGFPSLTTTSALNLYITSSGTTTASYTGADDTSGCEVTIGSTTTGVLLTSGTTTISIPTGTNLSTVAVRVQATPPPPPATTGRSSIGRLIVEVTEIYIST